MNSEPDEPKKDGPPPPNIKPPSTPPQSPSMAAGSPPPPPSTDPPVQKVPPVNVRVKEDSGANDPGDSDVDPALIPLGTRVVAALIDVGIGLGLYVGVTILASLPLLGLLGLLAWPVYIAFFLLRDSLPFLKGQSPGKTAMKIKVITTGGGDLVNNLQPALIRNAVLLIPFFGLVELIVLLTREDKADQGVRLGDEWAGTRVVRAEPATDEDEPGETPEA